MDYLDIHTFEDDTYRHYFSDDDFVGVESDPWFDFDDDNIVDDYDF